MPDRTAVTAPKAPAAIGPYSAAVWSGKQLFCSGQTPIDPATGELVAGDVAAQTHRCFDNLAAVLEAAGLTLAHAIKCNVYLVDMDDFAEMNGAYESRFRAPYPARTTVAVRALPRGARVEIELVARR